MDKARSHPLAAAQHRQHGGGCPQAGKEKAAGTNRCNTSGTPGRRSAASSPRRDAAFPLPEPWMGEHWVPAKQWPPPGSWGRVFLAISPARRPWPQWVPVGDFSAAAPPTATLPIPAAPGTGTNRSSSGTSPQTPPRRQRLLRPPFPRSSRFSGCSQSRVPPARQLCASKILAVPRSRWPAKLLGKLPVKKGRAAPFCKRARVGAERGGERGAAPGGSEPAGWGCGRRFTPQSWALPRWQALGLFFLVLFSS